MLHDQPPHLFHCFLHKVFPRRRLQETYLYFRFPSMLPITSLYASVVLILLLAPTDGQWYIMKKTYPSNLMNYPNPGKRSLPESDWISVDINCATPYSRVHALKEKAAWLLACSSSDSPLANDEEFEESRSELRVHPSRTLRQFYRRK